MIHVHFKEVSPEQAIPTLEEGVTAAISAAVSASVAKQQPFISHHFLEVEHQGSKIRVACVLACGPQAEDLHQRENANSTRYGGAAYPLHTTELTPILEVPHGN